MGSLAIFIFFGNLYITAFSDNGANCYCVWWGSVKISLKCLFVFLFLFLADYTVSYFRVINKLLLCFVMMLTFIVIC